MLKNLILGIGKNSSRKLKRSKLYLDGMVENAKNAEVQLCKIIATTELNMDNNKARLSNLQEEINETKNYMTNLLKEGNEAKAKLLFTNYKLKCDALAQYREVDQQLQAEHKNLMSKLDTVSYSIEMIESKKSLIEAKNYMLTYDFNDDCFDFSEIDNILRDVTDEAKVKVRVGELKNRNSRQKVRTDISWENFKSSIMPQPEPQPQSEFKFEA